MENKEEISAKDLKEPSADDMTGATGHGGVGVRCEGQME